MTINLERMTEGEAFDLFFKLRAKFDWCGSITSMGDVVVYRQGEEPHWSGNGPEMTDAMREVVRSTWEWRKGIEERCAEIGNELAPSIEVLPDGSFLIHCETYGEQRYTSDGEEA